MATQHIELSAESDTARDSVTALTGGDLGTLTAGNVAIVFDDTLNKHDMMVAIDKARDRINELLA